MMLIKDVINQTWRINPNELYDSFVEIQKYYNECREKIPDEMKMDECVIQMDNVIKKVQIILEFWHQKFF